MLLSLPLAALFFGLALIFIKLSTARVHPFLGNVLVMLSALGVQMAVLAYVRIKGVTLNSTPQGLWFGVLGGVAIGVYSIFLFMTFARVDIAKATPLIYIGAISISVVFGTLFLKEQFTWLNVLGLLLGFLGLFLLLWK